MVLKIDYDTVKLQSYRKYVIKMTSQKFSIFKPLPWQNPSYAPAAVHHCKGKIC